MPEQDKTKNDWLAWSLLGLVVAIPFIAWSEARSWSFGSLTSLSVFPLLGLWAWSIMWTHYAVGSVRLVSGYDKNVLYSKISGWMVLFLILMHPGLLAYDMYKTSDLLPPESFYSYAAESMRFFILLGTISLLAFLSYEILERMRKKRLVNKYWFWVSLSQMFAMVFIFVHALALGQHLQSGWFQFYWVVLGALLIPCFGLIARADWNASKDEKLDLL